MAEANLQDLLQESIDIVESIVAGTTAPEDSAVQLWAADWLARLEETPGKPEHDVVEDCLVDILTCDGQSWDTPNSEFSRDLEELREAVARLRQ